MTLLLFPILGVATGLVAARLTGNDGGPACLDLVTGGLGAVFAGWEALALAGITRPGLLAATATALGGAILLLGVVRVLSDRLQLEP
jgi:uncharacterized membrane protein YeaQ/YmgE (transglycosylase-associated protein family)